MTSHEVIAFCAAALLAAGSQAETIVFEQPECAGMSGFRAHWDRPIAVAEDGQRVIKDAVIKDRGGSAVWGGEQAGPLAFDAVHRSLLVRFPGAAERIAAALAAGKVIEKVELVLPFLDEELWPTGSGGADYPSADGYRYRTNWDCDKLYRAQRPNWHAVAHALRKPWMADSATGPTYNAAVNGAVFWKRFGASDPDEDRFPAQLGPAEVSSYQPDGRMDVTAVLTDEAYGTTLGERLRRLAECGFVVNKWETYDARYFQGAYEWAISTGPRAILIKRPQLVVTLAPGAASVVQVAAPTDVRALAEQHQDKPLGVPTAVVPTADAVVKLGERFMAKPAWMPDWQYAHVQQLLTLASGKLEPFYYRVLPQHVINRAREVAEREAKQRGEVADVAYAVYLAWLDWVHGQPPRWWSGHLTAADNITQWYNFREALPAPVQDSIIRSWTAWLMPERQTAMTDKQRKDFGDTSGQLIHPMADDPRVGVDATGKVAEWNQGDTYYRLTGDWRGNKSYYRSGFTRMMSTANFNSSAASGALLNGQIIGSEHAMADGRAGLMRFPFWLWTHNAGVGQEYIDHYYWAIATAGNKLFADFCELPEDRMAGWSIIAKTVNDLAIGYHPNLKKLLGPASRTCIPHVLGRQDGLYHILHVLSPQGALSDTDTGVLPALTPVADERGRVPRPVSAWGHDYPPATVAMQSFSGPWAEPWFAELVDDKPLPWSAMMEKKVVADGDWVTTHFGENYGLSSIRLTNQRIHVLGHWRRKAERPSGMRDVGTLDLRVGYNQTQIAEDGAGVISEQGRYRTYQHGGKLIMLARPNADFLAKQKEVKSVQCTAALFNFEAPAPTWEIHVDGQRLDALPATAKYGQVVTIRDGVSYLAIRPLPGDDLGRDAEVTLEEGVAQASASYRDTSMKAALIVNAYLYKSEAVIGAEAMQRLGASRTGFVVEFGDASEYGDFAAFQAHIRQAKLTSGADGVFTYHSGADTLVASWDAFTANGQDPYAEIKARRLLQDTSLSQMGQARLEKNGAVVERGGRHPELNLLLQTFPKQKLYVAMNLLPNYIDYSFVEPGGVRIVADGPLSMGRWAVRDSREIEIKYHAFGGKYLPKEVEAAPATCLYITGGKGKPQVMLNGQDANGTLEAVQHEGAAAWRLPLNVRQ